MTSSHGQPWRSWQQHTFHRLWQSVAVLAIAALAASQAPLKAAQDSLETSQRQLHHFPFAPNCSGNTQEMVACLWQRRNQADAALVPLLGTRDLLEQWRLNRRQVCGLAATKAQGGSVHPIVWLSCENALNKELLRQMQRPLLQSSDL